MATGFNAAVAGEDFLGLAIYPYAATTATTVIQPTSSPAARAFANSGTTSSSDVIARLSPALSPAWAPIQSSLPASSDSTCPSSRGTAMVETTSFYGTLPQLSQPSPLVLQTQDETLQYLKYDCDRDFKQEDNRELAFEEQAHRQYSRHPQQQEDIFRHYPHQLYQNPRQPNHQPQDHAQQFLSSQHPYHQQPQPHPHAHQLHQSQSQPPPVAQSLTSPPLHLSQYSAVADSLASAVVFPDWSLSRQSHGFFLQDPALVGINSLAASQFLPATGIDFGPIATTKFETAATTRPTSVGSTSTTRHGFTTSAPCNNATTTAGAVSLPGNISPQSSAGAVLGNAASLVSWPLANMEGWQDPDSAPLIQPGGLPGSLDVNSPTATYLEVMSQRSSGSDSSWTHVGMLPGFVEYTQQGPSIFNPSQTLHLRTSSDGTQSDGTHSYDLSTSSYDEMGMPYSPFSSTNSDSCVEYHNGGSGGSATGNGGPRNCLTDARNSPTRPLQPLAPQKYQQQYQTPGQHYTQRHSLARVSSLPVKGSVPTLVDSSNTFTNVSGTSSSSGRRKSGGIRKNPLVSKTTKQITRRATTAGACRSDGSSEKKIGRRRGPLLPEQRKQASEIRKLRACLRCKFLKKTCDKGDPCTGCKPAHARLWVVPCTRIDIKDIGFFTKDWKADHPTYLENTFHVYAYNTHETIMWFSHDYGAVLAVPVREVSVADDRYLQANWIETYHKEQHPLEFIAHTDKLDVGANGVSHELLGKYLDEIVDQFFEVFVTEHFEGTPFVSDLLMTAHRYYLKERTPMIRKALKLLVAYNLTFQITLVQTQATEIPASGHITHTASKYFGKIVAPAMVHLRIKSAMSEMWRELQKGVLEDLSGLYTSVYSGERLKNWPNIFMLAAILLTVWEEMQFDCHFREPNADRVHKFCTDMENIPVGVIVGLFHAISQKLPSFVDWDSRKHGHVLNDHAPICDALSEVRDHISRHESYLRSRTQAKFDPYDFDSLSNKFLAKLVIRSN